MAQTRFCVVCGEGSPREDWIKKSSGGSGVADKYIACDHHEQKEVDDAAAQVEAEAKAEAESKGTGPSAVATDGSGVSVKMPPIAADSGAPAAGASTPSATSASPSTNVSPDPKASQPPVAKTA